jgi:phage-related tail protein
LFADVKKGMNDAHGGFFSNLFGAGKGVFKNVERGLKDAFTAAKSLGSALGDVFKVLTLTAQEGITLQQSMNNVGAALAGVVAGIAEMSPGVLVLGAAIAALIIPIGAMVSGLLAAAGALTAGAIGVGALIAVGLPAVKNLAAGIRQLNSAQQAYSEASKNLNTGLRTSKQDMQQYQTVLKGVDSNLRGAVKLLRDSNARWQDLSRSQRRSVVALSENKDALKNMSPAMKAALTALLNQKQAYDNLTPSQRKFAASLSSVSREWRRVQAAARPVITLLLNDLAQLAKDVLPLVTPLINATGNSIHKLLVRADSFVKSEQFRTWVKKVTQEIPGVITAVGNFIGKLSALVGPIITNKKNLHDLHNTLNTVLQITQNVITILNTLSGAFRTVTSAGRGFIGFLDSVNNALNAVGSAAAGAASAIQSVMSAGASGGIGAALGTLGKIAGFAGGTPGAPPGWAWVGERGPELAKMNGGEVIIPHGPSMAMARNAPGYANGTPGWSDDRPIIVNVDGQKLFTIMKNRTYQYNVANNTRKPGGSMTGVLAN